MRDDGGGGRRSFRTTLALHLATAFSVPTLVVVLAVHVAVKEILVRGLDRSLSSVASLQAGAIGQSPPGAMRLHEWSLTPEEAAAFRDVNWFVEVWDSAGQSLLRSGYLPRDLPRDEEAFRRARRGELAYATEPWSEGRLRALYYPIERIDPRHTGHVLEVAGSMAPITRTMDRLDVMLAILAVLALLGAGAVGWFMAGHALAPVAEITRQAEGIEGAASGQRITAHAGTAEFHGLSAVLNRMLDRIEAAFEHQKRFVADASHELRSPIAALRGHLEVVRRRDRSKEEYEEAVDVALQEVYRLQALAEGLLTLARRDAGVLEPRLRRVSLPDLVGEVANSYRGLAASHDITLETELEPEVTVTGDPDLLARLIRNLVDNAIRYTPERGVVRLAVGRHDGSAWLEVRDTGPGVPPEHLPRIFDRFYRADESRERSAGAGLGLAIARAIAEAHGGRISAENGPEGGATFRVQLDRRT